MCPNRTKVALFSISIAAFVAGHAQAAGTPGSYQVEIVAADMCCKGCAQKVAGQLYAAPGVTAVDADVENKTVVVTVSRQNGATLEQLWQAVVTSKGGPTKLTTSNAVFTLTNPDALDKDQRLPRTTSYVVLENLTEANRAQRVADYLYAIQGVEKVSVDAQQNALIITTKQAVSPWALIGAVANAQERPVAVLGAYGKMSIRWLVSPASAPNQQAQQSNNGGIQR